MSSLFEPIYSVNILQYICLYLIQLILFPFAIEHFYKWLYWKTKWKFFRSGNWMSSPEETDAYCLVQDREKHKKENRKRGRD